jgi:hypothetical protein
LLLSHFTKPSLLRENPHDLTHATRLSLPPRRHLVDIDAVGRLAPTAAASSLSSLSPVTAIVTTIAAATI